MDIPIAASRPRGMELLQDDLRLMVFLELDFWSIMCLARTSKAWSTTYCAHQTYIYRRFLRDVIGDENMSIAIARYAASKLTWTPSPIHGLSKWCSLEELPGKVQDFGNKYLVPGDVVSLKIGITMASDMISFHNTDVKNLTSNIMNSGTPEESVWCDYLGLNSQEILRFEKSWYILEILRLLLPVYLDDKKKDTEIFTALCHFFPPWQLHMIYDITSNMFELCPIWRSVVREIPNLLFYSSDFVAFFSLQGIKGISGKCMNRVCGCGSMVNDRIQRTRKEHNFALLPRESYWPPPGTFSCHVEKGTLRHIQRADIEELLSKYPENDTGPADSWLYYQTWNSSLYKMLPSPQHEVSFFIYDRKRLEIEYGKSFPSRNELIDNLEGARLDYRYKGGACLKPACATDCAETFLCPFCRRT